MCALKVLSLIWTNPKKGLKHKRVLQRDAFEGETYYEAIPTTAILTTLISLTFVYELTAVDADADSPILLQQLIGSNGTLFLVTFTSSILTATFG